MDVSKAKANACRVISKGAVTFQSLEIQACEPGLHRQCMFVRSWNAESQPPWSWIRVEVLQGLLDHLPQLPIWQTDKGCKG